MTCVNRIIWQKIFLLNNVEARLALYSKNGMMMMMKRSGERQGWRGGLKPIDDTVIHHLDSLTTDLDIEFVREGVKRCLN